MINKKKDLLLITRGFPYGRGEAFLENEIEVLSKNFNTIYIYVQISFIDESFFDLNECRNTPGNVIIHKIPKRKKGFLAFLNSYILFNPIIFKEITSILFEKNFLNKTKTACNYFFEAHFTYKFIIKNTTITRSLLFYSYWFFHEPLTIILVKKKAKVIGFSRAHRADMYSHLQTNKYLPFTKYYLKNLNAIYSVSEDGKKYLIDKYKIKNKVFVSRLGTAPIKRTFKVSSNLIKIISIGALYNVKRIDLLVKAISTIDDINIEWHHFGEGPEKESTQLLANKIFGKNIKYKFHGFFKNEDLLKFIISNSFSILVNTSSSEGIPVSIMELMSSGIPAIATNVGGTREIVNSTNGYLLSSTPTTDEIADKIKHFHTLSENEKIKMSDAAFQMWENKFQAGKNYEKFVEQIINLK